MWKLLFIATFAIGTVSQLCIALNDTTRQTVYADCMRDVTFLRELCVREKNNVTNLECQLEHSCSDPICLIYSQNYHSQSLRPTYICEDCSYPFIPSDCHEESFILRVFRRCWIVFWDETFDNLQIQTLSLNSNKHVNCFHEVLLVVLSRTTVNCMWIPYIPINDNSKIHSTISY